MSKLTPREDAELFAADLQESALAIPDVPVTTASIPISIIPVAYLGEPLPEVEPLPFKLQPGEVYIPTTRQMVTQIRVPKPMPAGAAIANRMPWLEASDVSVVDAGFGDQGIFVLWDAPLRLRLGLTIGFAVAAGGIAVVAACNLLGIS